MFVYYPLSRLKIWRSHLTPQIEVVYPVHLELYFLLFRDKAWAGPETLLPSQSSMPSGDIHELIQACSDEEVFPPSE